MIKNDNSIKESSNILGFKNIIKPYNITLGIIKNKLSFDKILKE